MATDLAALVRGTVVWDPEPDAFASPWRTFRRCLETCPPDATNLCILQDDVTPVPYFRPVLDRAVAAQPDRVIALFVSASPRHHAEAVHMAAARGDDWAQLEHGYFFPVVGSVWPTVHIPSMLEFVDAQNWPPKFAADDEIVCHWMKDAGVVGVATVPCLVNHTDEVKSVTGIRAWAGADLNRVSTCVAPVDCDLRECDWTLGL